MGGGVIQTKILLPSNPTSIDVSSTSGTSVNISWTSPTSEKPIQKYRIYLYKSSTKPTLLNQMTYVSETNNLTYSVSNLTTDSTYYFAVTSVGSDGYENASIANTKSVTITENKDIVLVKGTNGWFITDYDFGSASKLDLDSKYEITFVESDNTKYPNGGFFIARNSSLPGLISKDGRNWKRIDTIQGYVPGTYGPTIVSAAPVDHARNINQSIAYIDNSNNVFMWFIDYDQVYPTHDNQYWPTFSTGNKLFSTENSTPGYILCTNGYEAYLNDGVAFSGGQLSMTVHEVTDNTLVAETYEYSSNNYKWSFIYYNRDTTATSKTVLSDTRSDDSFHWGGVACGLPTSDGDQIVLASTSRGLCVFKDGGKTIYRDWMTSLKSINPTWEHAPFPGSRHMLTYSKKKDKFYAYDNANIFCQNNRLSNITNPWTVYTKLSNLTNTIGGMPSIIVMN